MPAAALAWLGKPANDAANNAPAASRVRKTGRGRPRAGVRSLIAVPVPDEVEDGRHTRTAHPCRHPAATGATLKGMTENKRWTVTGFDEHTIHLKAPFRMLFNDNISLARASITTIEERQGHDVIVVSTMDGRSYEVLRGVARAQRAKTKEAFGL